MEKKGYCYVHKTSFYEIGCPACTAEQEARREAARKQKKEEEKEKEKK